MITDNLIESIKDDTKTYIEWLKKSEIEIIDDKILAGP